MRQRVSRPRRRAARGKRRRFFGRGIRGVSTHDRSATVTGPVGAVPNARATEGAVEGRRLRSALLRAMLLCAEPSGIGRRRLEKIGGRPKIVANT